MIAFISLHAGEAMNLGFKMGFGIGQLYIIWEACIPSAS